MQIVINICKDDFEEICMQARMVEDTGSLFGRIRKAIFHGVSLPKGCGHLINADKAISKICGNKCGCHLEECGYDKSCYPVEIIKSASIIIEADRSEENV